MDGQACGGGVYAYYSSINISDSIRSDNTANIGSGILGLTSSIVSNSSGDLLATLQAVEASTDSSNNTHENVSISLDELVF